MKRALCSFAFGFWFTFMLFILSPLSGVMVRLLSVSSYVLFWRPWFGLDCANADSISDKLSCAGLMLSVDVLIYAAITFGFLTLMQRFKKPGAITSSVEHSTLGLG